MYLSQIGIGIVQVFEENQANHSRVAHSTGNVSCILL